ncbi:LysR family transcriptional regulator [Streptomyces sp. NBC_00102]|uniref:LysR family transcriptional regulator n=1 Tax=Streptomyces sp. NBC_00102 TaxID=2975652 RepID=UPI00224CBE01|nr:LysR family transcriptional regulator [Streptomyces sp. NBC_00102]MCX5400694.1 LysR family transcriptional regulator [Streptomyces sp. NBC_00102]
MGRQLRGGSVELRHLRTFETVARTLSVTRAARELHYAQSSVSDQIHSLERELGVELLDRSQRAIRLTPQGAMLSEYTDRILKLLEEARWAVSRPGSELAIGTLETVGLHLLPSVLSQYRSLHPRARVRVGQDSRGELYKAVRRGDLDLCLTFGDPPADAGLRSETLAEQPLVVIVPPGHHLAERGRAGLHELTAEPFLATERGCGFREMYDNTFGSVPSGEPIAEVSGIGTLGACVAAGMGCALLPLISVRAQADRGEVAVVEVGGTDLRTTVTMTWLDRNSANPGLMGFQRVLREQLGV